MNNVLREHPKATLGVACLLAVALYLGLRSGPAASGGSTFTARRGPLDISVLASGTIEALEKQEIRCEVRGDQVKILRLVDEGYFVTEEDVRTNKVLVELDASKLQQNAVNQDITFQSTVSALTEAQQAYEIQANQNRVDVKAAEQDAKFAFMDAEKYLGDRIMRELVGQLGLRERTNAPVARPGGATNGPPVLAPEPVVAAVDYSQYAKAELLGDGLAKQELRKREDDVFTSRTALAQAQTKLAGTRRLFDKGFVTKTELESDQTAADQGRLKLESAETSKDLFIKYEFPKMAEEQVGKYEKALRTLERARKEAVSKLAQAEAKLRGAEGRHQIERDNLNEIKETIRKCVITATRSGLVAYGGGDDGMYWGGRDPIRVGSQVFERQVILTIPDTSKVGVKLQINETHIKKMRKGLAARITAEAQPEDKLDGEVSKVGVLPDSRNRWMSPDMNVYQCSVDVKGTREWLKPGMSTKVEILVKQLPDCVYIPLQSVSVVDGKQVVYLAGARPVARVVEVGEFNDEFIEVRRGVAAGDVVLLRAPDSEKKNEGDAPRSPKDPVAPAAKEPARATAAAH